MSQAFCPFWVSGCFVFFSFSFPFFFFLAVSVHVHDSIKAIPISCLFFQPFREAPSTLTLLLLRAGSAFVWWLLLFKLVLLKKELNISSDLTAVVTQRVPLNCWSTTVQAAEMNFNENGKVQIGGQFGNVTVSPGRELPIVQLITDHVPNEAGLGQL